MQNVSEEISETSEKEIGTETIWDVTRYLAGWDFDNHQGKIGLYDPFFRIITTRYFDSPAEFSAIVDLLRNEKPMRFNTSTRMLYTEGGEKGEVVGEEES